MLYGSAVNDNAYSVRRTFDDVDSDVMKVRCSVLCVMCLGADAVPTVLVRWNGLNQSVAMTALRTSHLATLDVSTYLKKQSVFVQ